MSEKDLRDKGRFSGESLRSSFEEEIRNLKEGTSSRGRTGRTDAPQQHLRSGSAPRDNFGAGDNDTNGTAEATGFGASRRRNSWTENGVHNDFVYGAAKHTLATMIAKHEQMQQVPLDPSGVLFYPDMNSKFLPHGGFPFPAGSLPPRAPLTSAQQPNFRPEAQSQDKLVQVQASKIRRLEAQLEEAKGKCQQKDEEIVSLRRRLQSYEESSTIGNNVTATDRLNREKSELTRLVEQLREKIRNYAQREVELCEHLEESLRTAEAAKMEESETQLANRQLLNQLESLQTRYNELMEQFKQVNSRREASNSGAPVGSVTSSGAGNYWDMAHLQQLLTSVTVERDSLASKLRTALDRVDEESRKLSAAERHHANVESDLQAALNRAILQRSTYEAEVNRLKESLNTERSKLQQEVNLLREEVTSVRFQLAHSQQALEASSAERLNLQTHNQELQRQVAQLTLDREFLTRSQQEQVNRLQSEAAQREMGLLQQLAQSELSKSQAVEHLQEVVQKQNTLIDKLRHECHVTLKKLEHITARYHEQGQSLSGELDDLAARLEMSQQRNEELERQCVEHAKTHDDMRQHVADMDAQMQRQSEQIVDLLNKESEHLLELSSLRKQLAIAYHHLRFSSHKKDGLNEMSEVIPLDMDSYRTHTIPAAADTEEKGWRDARDHEKDSKP